MDPKWLEWSRKLQAIAQTGLYFHENTYDTERYEQVRAIAAEMLAHHGNLPDETVHDLVTHDTGYTTPKVDVRAACFRDDTVLLVKEIEDGGWTLPGGWADVGDTPAGAVEREVWEESGFTAKVVKVAGVLDRIAQGHVPPIPFHTYKLFFLCEITGGEARASNETSAVDFFPVQDLPPLSVARVTEKQIRRLHEHHCDPTLPADWD
jgi:ADP-ribose pyrophosphatase YjhB (NUDIX family)